MKNILISVVATFMSFFVASGQEVMEFQGVPISGTVSSCGQALRKKGFKRDRVYDEIYRGKYRGAEVELLLAANPGSDEVAMFVLSYPIRSSWDATYNLYDTVKMMLTSDYGRATMVQEEYDYPYTEKDGFRALDYGKSRFISTFSIYQGGTTSNGLNPGGPSFMKKEALPLIGEITLTISEDHRVRIFFRPISAQ